METLRSLYIFWFKPQSISAAPYMKGVKGEIKRALRKSKWVQTFTFFDEIPYILH